MTAALEKRTVQAAVWWTVCVTWVAAWVLFLFTSGRVRSQAGVVLVVCMAVIAVLKWRDRRPVRGKED